MPRGRPSLLTDDVRKTVQRLACLGLTDKQFAAVLGVSEKTFNAWKKDADFRRSLNEGKGEADACVEASLWQRANGYSHESVKIFCNNGQVTQVPFIEHYPPDPTSMIFWLKNRRPDRWRDKIEQEHSGTVVIDAPRMDRVKPGG